MVVWPLPRATAVPARVQTEDDEVEQPVRVVEMSRASVASDAIGPRAWEIEVVVRPGLPRWALTWI